MTRPLQEALQVPPAPLSCFSHARQFDHRPHQPHHLLSDCLEEGSEQKKKYSKWSEPKFPTCCSLAPWRPSSSSKGVSIGPHRRLWYPRLLSAQLPLTSAPLDKAKLQLDAERRLSSEVEIVLVHGPEHGRGMATFSSTLSPSSCWTPSSFLLLALPCAWWRQR